MSDMIKPTFDEIISTLEHSSLATIIVEGIDDIIIYRKLESILEGVDVLPVYGRKNVLDIFDEKERNPKLKNKKIVFIADKDIWCNIGVPKNYIDPSLVFTSGYSIENDIFIDYNCQKIIDNNKNKQEFNDDKAKFINWYALALQETLTNINIKTTLGINSNIHPDRNLSKHPHEVLNNFNSLSMLKTNEKFPYNLVQSLNDDFPLTIRGKSLIALFIKSCSHHKSLGLFESVAERPGFNIERIFSDVSKNFS